LENWDFSNKILNISLPSIKHTKHKERINPPGCSTGVIHSTDNFNNLLFYYNTMAKKVIGNQEILVKYQRGRQDLREASFRLLKKCQIKLERLVKLKKFQMNEADENRLNKAMGRIVSFKGDLLRIWKKNLEDEFLEEE